MLLVGRRLAWPIAASSRVVWVLPWCVQRVRSAQLRAERTVEGHGLSPVIVLSDAEVAVTEHASNARSAYGDAPVHVQVAGLILRDQRALSDQCERDGLTDRPRLLDPPAAERPA